jgi:hypothetical protein
LYLLSAGQHSLLSSRSEPSLLQTLDQVYFTGFEVYHSSSESKEGPEGKGAEQVQNLFINNGLSKEVIDKYW